MRIQGLGQVPVWARAPTALLLYVVLSLALQVTSFGDTNRHADEMFYFLVGQRMHEGLVPYVDVWDRKPIGLFLIYYLMAGLSPSVWVFQAIACLFVAATALVVGRLAALWSGWRGGLAAGLVYVLAVQPFEGGTGQTPDFYNLFVACAALLVVQEIAAPRSSWRAPVAMALCGLAITVKQTALFESAFLGLSLLAALHRSGAAPWRIARAGALFCAIGVLPTALAALAYALTGHFSEWWQAMVLSNLARDPAPGSVLARHAVGIVLQLAVLVPIAIWGIVGARRDTRLFLTGWLPAAFLGFIAVPAFSVHYVLPLIVPLSVAAGLLIDRHRLRLPLFAALALFALVCSPPDYRLRTQKSVVAMDELAVLVRRHDGGGGLLVFDGPSYLYEMTGKPFLTPLAFPHHLNHGLEDNVSHLDTHAEVDRVLAARPGVIVLSRWPRNFPINAYTRTRVLAHAHAHCRFSRIVELAGEEMVVRGDCASGASATGHEKARQAQ